MEIISLSKNEISAYLEITDPFLLIDSVDELVPGKSARGHKKLNESDWFFQCHLPKERVMPGTLLTEAMLQTLVLTLYVLEGHRGKPSFVTQLKTQLYSKVTPNGSLIIEAALSSFNRGIAKGEVIVLQGGRKVCRGEFTFASPHALPRAIT